MRCPAPNTTTLCAHIILYTTQYFTTHQFCFCLNLPVSSSKSWVSWTSLNEFCFVALNCVSCITNHLKHVLAISFVIILKRIVVKICRTNIWITPSTLRHSNFLLARQVLPPSLIEESYCTISYCRAGYSPNSVSKLRLNASINIGPVLCFSRHSLGSRPGSDVYPNHF